MPEEAAISRLYGGIHYRSEGGKEHGARQSYTVQFTQHDLAN